MRISRLTALFALVMTSGVALAGGALAQEPTGYADMVKAEDGVVGYWLFDDTENLVATAEVGDVDGAYAKGVKLGATGLFPNGPDLAADLDGQGDAYIDFGDHFDFAGAEPFTIELWVKPGAFENPYPRIVQKEGKDDQGRRQGYVIYLNKDTGKLGFERWQDGAPDLMSSKEPLVMAEPSHVVATFDGTKMRLYVNGVLSDESAATRQLPDTANPFRVGARADGASPFAGAVSNLAVYDVALAPERIAEHYAVAMGAAATTSTTTEAASTPEAPAATTPEVVGMATTAPDAAPTEAPIGVPTEPAAAATTEPIPTEAAAVAPVPTATAAPTRTGVTTEEVNFRAGPTQDTEIISIIPSGTEVKVYDTVVDNYVRVEIDGRKGWISADYLSIE